MTNEELAKRFIETKAVDFNAIGSLFAEVGPTLSASKTDLNMVLVGKPFILACFLTAFEAPEMLERLRSADLAGAMKR